jgi:hypothetical protein
MEVFVCAASIPAIEQGMRMEEILRRLREERDEGVDTEGDPPSG